MGVMKSADRRPAASLVLLALAVSARAQTPAERVQSLLDGVHLSGEGPQARLILTQAPAEPAPGGSEEAPSVVPPDLWGRLAPVGAEQAAWLRARLPDLDLSAARTVTAEAGEALLAAAAASRTAYAPQGLTTLDLFTDVGFRGPQLFYIPEDVIVRMESLYELRLITPTSATAEDGTAFRMQALVIGGGRVEVLYGGEYRFANPDFNGQVFTVQPRVSHRIAGDSDMDQITGAKGHESGVAADIIRVRRVSPSEGRVHVALGPIQITRSRTLYPIRLRP